jgi:hypothetical protein
MPDGLVRYYICRFDKSKDRPTRRGDWIGRNNYLINVHIPFFDLLLHESREITTIVSPVFSPLFLFKNTLPDVPIYQSSFVIYRSDGLVSRIIYDSRNIIFINLQGIEFSPVHQMVNFQRELDNFGAQVFSAIVEI